MSQSLSALSSTPGRPDLPSVTAVAADGDLDEAAAMRLLRWCEARLHLVDLGRADPCHLVVDLAHARRATSAAVAILDQARLAARRRHLEIYLVGVGPLMARSSLPVRRYLGRWSAFPSLEAVYATLDGSGGVAVRATQRAVDPDSIVVDRPS